MSEIDFFSDEEHEGRYDRTEEEQPHGGSLQRTKKITLNLKPNIAFDTLADSAEKFKQPVARNIPTVESSPEDALDQYSHLTAEFVYSRITEYFLFCTDKQVPATFNGLAIRLDIDVDDLKTLPFKNPAVQYAFKKAKMVIAEFVETQLLMGKSPVGLIFWLKNMDNWVDKTEVVTRRGMGEELDALERQKRSQRSFNRPIDGTLIPPAPTPPESNSGVSETIPDGKTPIPEKPANFPF